jgi:nucleotide sugar dehydrogenase
MEKHRLYNLKNFSSRSPFGDCYYFEHDDKDKIIKFVDCNKNKKIVVIQGLGFVGSIMLAAVSLARNRDGQRKYAVIGIDLPDSNNYWKIGRINRGLIPVISEDILLGKVYSESYNSGSIMATTNSYVYEIADIIVVDINLDIQKKLGRSIERKVNMGSYKKTIKFLSQKIKPNCLLIIETTLPPGTCSKVILPIFDTGFKKRGIKVPVNLVHSYERVMPGKNYLNSITSYYRVFSANNRNASKRAVEFFNRFIDTKNYPLVELNSMTDSEMAKVLENTYRAANIALIQEWTEFADRAGVNLFKVIDAIKMRKTHQNIMLPGFGVGGYCLTKDSLLADWAYNTLFKSNKNLPMSIMAVDINDLMPKYSFKLLKKCVKNLNGKRILIMGVSYLKDVADTRSSPTELFYNLCKREGAEIFLHDPLVRFWKEKNIEIETNMRKADFKNIDAVVLTVAYNQYKELAPDVFFKLAGKPRVVIDANNVLSDEKARTLSKEGVLVVGVGKGHWNNLLREGK